MKESSLSFCIAEASPIISAAAPLFSSSHSSKYLSIYLCKYLFSVYYKWGSMDTGREPMYTWLSVVNRDLCIINLQTFRTMQVLGISAWNKRGMVQTLMAYTPFPPDLTTLIPFWVWSPLRFKVSNSELRLISPYFSNSRPSIGL